MKADPCGGYTEQIRAKFGWKSKAKREVDGGDAGKCCGYCKFRKSKLIERRDNSITFSTYCTHPESCGDEGFATRESACCDKWEQIR